MKKVFWGALLAAGLAVSWAVAQDQDTGADASDVEGGSTGDAVEQTGTADTGAATTRAIPQSLDQALGRGFVLVLDEAPAPMSALVGALDRRTGAVLFPTADIDIFAVDVYVLFMDGKGTNSVPETHPLREVILRELAKAEPQSGINLFTVSVEREEDNANRNLGVILVDKTTTQNLSYLCMAVGIYDQARWFFTVGAQERTYARFQACHEQGWTRLEQAF